MTKGTKEVFPIVMCKLAKIDKKSVKIDKWRMKKRCNIIYINLI